MGQNKGKMGSPEVRTAGDTILFIQTTFHLRPGILLAVHNGSLVYQGEAALAPPDIMSLPGLVAIMHPHDKARLDAALNKAARLDRSKGPLPQNVEEAQAMLDAGNSTMAELSEAGITHVTFETDGNLKPIGKPRVTGFNPTLAAPYGEAIPGAPYDVIVDEEGNIKPAPTPEQKEALEHFKLEDRVEIGTHRMGRKDGG